MQAYAAGSGWPGLSAAAARSDAADLALREHLQRLPSTVGPVALVALGAYGRRELTPRADLEVLFLHAGTLTLQEATERVCYPLWELHFGVEPLVRTLAACAADARRSPGLTMSLLDAR